MKKTLLIFVAMLEACLPARAQEDSDGPFIFSPQCAAQAQFAGYYVAYERGFYEEEGLDVQIVHPYSTQSSLDRILHGQCHATTLPLSLAMKTVGDGLPLVNILQTSMNNSTLIVSRWGDDPMTLRGAKAAITRAGFDQIATCVTFREDLDYEWIQAASCVNVFVSGAVAATLANSYNEYLQILQTGIIQPGVGVYRFEDHGYNIQQEGVYMTREYYEKHRDQAEKFARASLRGWKWAASHPEKALDITMEYVRRDRIATNRVLQELMLKEVLRLQVDRESGKREFRVRPDMVDRASGLLLETGLLQRPVTADELLP